MIRQIVPYMQLQLRETARLCLSPYEWEKGSPSLTLVKPKRKWQDYRVNLAINVLYLGIMTGNYLWTREDLNFTQKILALVFIFASFCCLMYRLNFLWKEKELVDLIGSIVKFEEINRPVPLGGGQSLTVLFSLFANMTAVPVTVLVGALLYAQPCMAPALEFLVLGQGGTCSASQLGLAWRLPLILFDAYIWYSNLTMTAFYMFLCCFGIMRCLDQYLRNVEQMLGGEDRDVDYRKGVRVYQQVQLLGKVFNEAFQAVFFPFIMFGGWVFFVLSLYACVKLHDLIDMPEFALFPVNLVESLATVLVVKVGANVIDQSERCLEVARKNKKFGSGLVFKRMIRSMGRIRVRFGSTNFVEQLTPFNLLNHGLDTCVNLMLLS